LEECPDDDKDASVDVGATDVKLSSNVEAEYILSEESDEGIEKRA
jgi:hypothetical protein